MVRDLWHLAFADLVSRRGPSSFELLLEFLLTLEPQRADMILLRRRGRRSSKAKLLRSLWPWLAKVTILEYKSPVASSFRPGDLLRLVGYGILYDTAHQPDLASPRDLTLALVLPAIVPALTSEIARMGWTLVPLADGYARIDGAPYTIFVAAIDEVCEAEKDGFLAVFSRTRKPTGEAAGWLRRWLTEETMKRRNMKNTQSYDEMFQKLVEAWPVEKRLAGLDPAQRLAGLDPAHAVLALPPEILSALSEEFIRSLPPDVQREVKRRLRRARAASAASPRP